MKALAFDIFGLAYLGAILVRGIATHDAAYILGGTLGLACVVVLTERAYRRWRNRHRCACGHDHRWHDDGRLR